MQKTWQEYAPRLAKGEVEAHVSCRNRRSGIVFDPANLDHPLNVLGFGYYRLNEGPVALETGDREYVIVPQAGAFAVTVDGRTFKGERAGGPFARDAETNACAVYVPRDCAFTMTGDAEAIVYSAPSSRKMKPVYLAPGDRAYVSRGIASWRRDVVTLIEPGDISTNLVVGETYSPPGLWSGTPLHVHDCNDPDAGQSDHEEVYFHVMRLRGRDPIGAYGVQLLFDADTFHGTYLVQDRSAIAIPGGSHPVVASPVTDHIYGWGLGGVEGALGMWDIPEFKFLKDVQKVIEAIESEHAKPVLPRAEIERRGREAGLNDHGVEVLILVLREIGYAVPKA